MLSHTSSNKLTKRKNLAQNFDNHKNGWTLEQG